MEPQNAVQQALGMHTTAQSGVGNPNNGNPNTVYNTAAPTTTAGPTTATSPWIGTMAANPINMPFNATGLLAPPQFAGTGSGGSAVSDILSRIGTGNFGLPNTGTTTPPTTTPTTPAPNPNPYNGGGSFKPIGPISGPIGNNQHNWQSNYANAQSNTNAGEAGYGRWAGAPWMTNGQQGNNPNFDISPEKANDLYKNASAWGDLGSKAVDLLLGKDFRADVTGQNGWKGALSQLANVFIPGGNMLVDAIFGQGETNYTNEPKLFKDKVDQLNNVLRMAKSGNLTKEQINDKLGDLIKSAQTGGNGAWDIYNNAPRMSNQQWARTQDRIGLANLFARGGAGDIGQQLGREAEAKVRASIARRGNVQR